MSTAEAVRLVPQGNRHRQAWDEDAVLAAVGRWIDATGKPPTSDAWQIGRPAKNAQAAITKARAWQDAAALYEAGTYPSNDTIRRLFGSFGQMLEAAGIPRRPEGRTPRAVTDAQEAMLRLRSGGMAAGPQQLALDIRVVLQANAAGDRLALRGALMDLAASALAWCDQIGPEAEEHAAA